jgi:hypothetical protein
MWEYSDQLGTIVPKLVGQVQVYNGVLMVRYCWRSDTAGGQVLLAVRYCWRSGTAGCQVLLAVRYCWLSGTAGGQVLLVVRNCWLSGTAGCQVLLAVRYSTTGGQVYFLAVHRFGLLTGQVLISYTVK